MALAVCPSFKCLVLMHACAFENMRVFFLPFPFGFVLIATAEEEDNEQEGQQDDLSRVGAHSFARMSGDHDSQRRETLQGRTRDESAAAERDRM